MALIAILNYGCFFHRSIFTLGLYSLWLYFFPRIHVYFKGIDLSEKTLSLLKETMIIIPYIEPFGLRK